MQMVINYNGDSQKKISKVLSNPISIHIMGLSGLNQDISSLVRLDIDIGYL